MPPASPSLPDSSPRPCLSWRRAPLLALWLVLGFYYCTPVWRVLEPDLDSSIHATYAHFTAHGYQFGSQVNTTAGPYGFVMFGWDYSGELFWLRLVLMLGFTLGLAALTLWFLGASARSTPWHWLWLAAMILGLSVGDNLFTVAMLLCGLFLLLNYAREDRLQASLAATVFLSFLSLIKGTQLAEAAGVLLCVAVLAGLSRAWRRAAWIAAAYLASLVVWWSAAGQNPLHLPAYANGIRHIAQGYNEAMALETPTRLLTIGAASALGLLALLLWTGLRRHASPVMVACCALLAGFTYLSWKHGFVRSDGHMFIYMDFAGIAAFTVPMLEQILALPIRRISTRIVSIVFSLAVAAFGLWGSQQLHATRLGDLLHRVGPELNRNLHAVLAASQLKAEFDTELSLRRVTCDLPQVRKAVGRRSIDFYGYEIGLLLLNGFNYQPPPMCCGTYHVYNRYFKELNLRHFLDPSSRPDFLLLKLQSIDGRFATIDDSLSLLAILNLYRPVLIEDSALLLEGSPAPAAAPAPRLIATRSVRFDEEVEVPAVGPDEMLLFSCDLPSSLRGELLAVAYKPPLVFMDVSGPGLLQTKDLRVVATSVAVPSLLNPTLENTEDLLALLAGHPAKQVRRLRLHTPEPACFQAGRLRLSFYTVPRPPVSAPRPLPRYYAPSVFREAPDFIQPPQEFTPFYKEDRVQYVHSPTRVGFTLHGTERELDLVIGINENAYLQGRVDGVTFTVELEQPGQLQPQLVARRALQPLYVPADRGNHQLRAPLPPTDAPGSRLIIRTDPVPGGGNAWGWAFITHVRLVRGPFLDSQFPGFRTLPVAVESVGCGIIPQKERDILMVAAPSTLLFNLPAGASEAIISGGLLPGSYTGGAQTDGAEFILESVHRDGSTTPLFRRWLQPVTNPVDRGDQTMHVPLPPQPAGSQLRLNLTVGPNGNNAWDWTYLTGFQLR